MAVSRKKNFQVDVNAEIEARLAEAEEKWKENHKPKISMKYGNTYISFGLFDHITQTAMGTIHLLLWLMGIKFSVSFPFTEDDSYFTMFEGEDSARTEYIQKFIDNGYCLDWK